MRKLHRRRIADPTLIFCINVISSNDIYCSFFITAQADVIIMRVLLITIVDIIQQRRQHRNQRRNV